MPRKYRKKTERAKLEEKLLDTWSLLVKQRAGFKCELSGKSKFQTVLNSHHIITKKCQALRYDVRNGVCLGSGEHTLNRWSAHQAPKWFEEQMKEIRLDDWEYCQKHKWDTKKGTVEELREKLKELEEELNES